METVKKPVEPQKNQKRQWKNRWKQGKTSGAPKKSATPQILLEGFWFFPAEIDFFAKKLIFLQENRFCYKKSIFLQKNRFVPEKISSLK